MRQSMETTQARDEPLVGDFGYSDGAGDDTPRSRCEPAF